MVGLGLGTAMFQRQEMQLKQTLTPQQRQLVRLLELSDQEVEPYLDDLAQMNPALKRSIESGPVKSVRKAFVRRPSDDDLPPIEDRMSASSDLMEQLFADYRLERTTDGERRAGFQIIGNLDEHGFLAGDLAEVARDAGVTEEEARSAQGKVMRLDPMGCGADDLTHYLTWIVGERWPEDPFFPDLIAHHLDGLKRQKFRSIGKKMDMHPEDVEEYHAMLQEVPPYPAQGYKGFEESDAQYVQPTMEVVFDDEKNTWAVVMDDEPKHRFQVDHEYEAELAAMEDGPEKKAAMEKLEEARWVVRNMEERHSLVKQIANLAVARQADFFEQGPAHLKNLTMASVSEILQRDTSTISRAVMGRYFRYEGGVMALRDLFTNRGGSTDTSEAQLHAAIAEIVDGEDKKKPLSDAAIGKALKARGIKASRRTVAKHRDRMGIPSSRDRRER